MSAAAAPVYDPVSTLLKILDPSGSMPHSEVLSNANLPIKDESMRDKLYTHMWSELVHTPCDSTCPRMPKAIKVCEYIAKHKPVDVCVERRLTNNLGT